MAGAALICHRPGAATVTEFTWWPDAATARAAMQQLAPCSPDCVGIHTIAWADNGRCRSESHGLVPYTFGCRKEPPHSDSAPETMPS